MRPGGVAAVGGGIGGIGALVDLAIVLFTGGGGGINQADALSAAGSSALNPRRPRCGPHRPGSCPLGLQL